MARDGESSSTRDRKRCSPWWLPANPQKIYLVQAFPFFELYMADFVRIYIPQPALVSGGMEEGREGKEYILACGGLTLCFSVELVLPPPRWEQAQPIHRLAARLAKATGRCAA